MPIIFYESLGDFVRALPDPNDSKYTWCATPFRARDWNGNQTFADAKANLFKGDEKALEESRRILDQVDADGIALASSQWEHAVTGYIPCVPSYLAGSPESMRRLVDYQSDVSPIKIFVSGSVAAGFSGGDMAKRGATILALVRKLQQIRPVSLYFFGAHAGPDNRDATGNCAIPVIQVDTNPMDLTTASYMFGNPGFVRQLTMGWASQWGYDGSFAWGKRGRDMRSALIKHLGVTDQDLLIDPSFQDSHGDITADPVKWVNDQVKRYANSLEDLC